MTLSLFSTILALRYQFKPSQVIYKVQGLWQIYRYKQKPWEQIYFSICWKLLVGHKDNSVKRHRAFCPSAILSLQGNFWRRKNLQVGAFFTASYLHDCLSRMSDRFGLKVKENAGKTKYSSLNLNQTYKGTKVETKTSSGLYFFAIVGILLFILKCYQPLTSKLRHCIEVNRERLSFLLWFWSASLSNAASGFVDATMLLSCGVRSGTWKLINFVLVLRWTLFFRRDRSPWATEPWKSRCKSSNSSSR